jgi:hypothetical protein
VLLGHTPNKVFLVHVPNSCGATEINGNSTSSDVTDDTIENELNDSCFNYFLTICNKMKNSSKSEKMIFFQSQQFNLSIHKSQDKS